jgi:hypothetical protein
VTTVAHGASREFVPPRPGFGDALYATLLGFVIASVVVLVPVFVATWLGLAGREPYGPFGGGGLLDWPYRRTGTFSLIANAVVCLELLAFTALFVRGMLADRVGPVSTVPIFVVLAVTGLAPLIPHGFLDAPGIVDLLLSAWLIQVAVATTAIRPLSKRTTARAIMVLVMLLAIPAAYGATHPVRTGSSYGPFSAKELTVAIRNDGFADVRVTRVSLDTDVSGIRATVRGPMPFTLSARRGTRVRLRVQQAGCGAGGPMSADALVRYRVFGSTQIAKIPVEVPIKACARG